MDSLDELSKRQDPVPDGVEQQIGFFAGGDDECNDRQPHEPLDVWLAGPLTVPGVPIICILAAPADVQVTVVTPTGYTFTTTEPALEGAGFHAIPLPLPPGSPTGTYKIYVTQDRLKAKTGFETEPIHEPRIWVHPETSAPGTTVEFYLGGFPPGPADLHLYMCTDTGRKGLTYRTTRAVTVDSSGAALLLLETTARSTPTCYALVDTRYFAPRGPGQGLPPVFARFKLVP